jgi:hypothetical protein
MEVGIIMPEHELFGDQSNPVQGCIFDTECGTTIALRNCLQSHEQCRKYHVESETSFAKARSGLDQGPGVQVNWNNGRIGYALLRSNELSRKPLESLDQTVSLNTFFYFSTHPHHSKTRHMVLPILSYLSHVTCSTVSFRPIICLLGLGSAM